MAKRRTKRASPRRRASFGSRFARKVRRSSTKSMSFMGVDLIKDLALPGAYGFVRADVAGRLQPLFAKIPLAEKFGNSVDEVGMIAANALIGKFVGSKIPVVRDLTRQGIRCEAFMLGNDLRAGTMGIKQPGGSSGSWW